MSAAQASATPEPAERIVRLCARHMVPLEVRGDALHCPGNGRGRGHATKLWVVADLVQLRVYASATEDGHEAELQRPLGRCEDCSKLFLPAEGRAPRWCPTCSPRHRVAAKRRCEDCHKPFRVAPGRGNARHRPARWCRHCRWRHRGKKPVYVFTAEADRLLRERYDTRVRGRAAEIAATLGMPAWRIKRRACELGLTTPRGDRKPWTDADRRFLERHVGRRLVPWIARQLGRSLTAVQVELKRLKISRAMRVGYTQRELAECFGVDPHVVGRWVEAGQLTGARGVMGVEKARAAWHFTEADVVRFISAHPTAFELRRVDQRWFLRLVGPGWPTVLAALAGSEQERAA